MPLAVLGIAMQHVAKQHMHAAAQQRIREPAPRDHMQLELCIRWPRHGTVYIHDLVLQRVLDLGDGLARAVEHDVWPAHGST